MEGDEIMNDGRVTLVCREKGCGDQCEMSFNVDLKLNGKMLGKRLQLACIRPVIAMEGHVEKAEFEIVHAWTWED